MISRNKKILEQRTKVTESSYCENGSQEYEWDRELHFPIKSLTVTFAFSQSKKVHISL